MKTMIFVLSLLMGLNAYATSTAATKEIFEILVKTDNTQAKLRAPMTVTAENIVCSAGSGSPQKFTCSAKFPKNGKKNIVGDNNIFFKHLSDKNAIALAEMVHGGTIYKAKSISCQYTLDQQPYYKCTSEVSMKF